MPFRMLARKIIGTVFNNCAVTNIGTGAWVQLLASIPLAASAIEIFNPSDAKLQISLGAAGHETDAGKLITYTVLPGGSTGILPAEIPSGARLSVKAIDQAMINDYFIINFFG